MTDGIALYGFDPESGDCRLQRRIRAERVDAGMIFRFNRAGDRLYGRGWSGVLQVVNVDAGRLDFEVYAVMSGHPRFPRLDRDGRRLIPGPPDEGRRIYGTWSVAEGRECRLVSLVGTGSGCGAVAVSPDGRVAAAAGAHGWLVLFETATWREVGRTRFPYGDDSLRPTFDGLGRLLTNTRSGCFRWPARPDPDDPDGVVFGPPERLPFHPGSYEIATSRDGGTVAQAMPNAFGMQDYSGAWVVAPGRPAASSGSTSGGLSKTSRSVPTGAMLP